MSSMLYNKSIFITGANRGIGFELVKESLNKNAFVFGTFRNKSKAKELYLIKSHNFNSFQMNVIEEASIKEISNKLTKPIDFLVCNAGINNGFGNFFDEDHSHEKMLEVLNVNVLGCILTIRNLRKNLNGNARIILISSTLGIISNFLEESLTLFASDLNDAFICSREFLISVNTKLLNI